MKKKTKTIRLFGYDWKVIEGIDEKKDGGGSFSWVDKTITVNNRYGERKAILLHEIVEAILVHNHARYYGNEGNSEYKFYFNHTQFCRIVYDIYQALEDNKKVIDF